MLHIGFQGQLTLITRKRDDNGEESNTPRYMVRCLRSQNETQRKNEGKRIEN